MKKSLVYFVGALVVLGCATLLTYRERNTYRCQLCWSKRHEFQWHFGQWGGGGLPLTAARSVFVPSAIFDTYLAGSKHQHQWAFAQGSPYYWFGTRWGGCAIGAGRHETEIASMFEASDEFRLFVAKRVTAGELTIALFLELAAAPDGSGVVAPADGGPGEAGSLVAEYFAGKPVQR